MPNAVCKRKTFVYLLLAVLLALNAGVFAQNGTNEACPSAYSVTNIIHANGAFYAVDFKGHVLRTENGEEWSVHKVDDKSSLPLFDIAWNGEYFVVTTAITNHIYRSRDAITWQHVVQLDGGNVVPRLRAYEGTFYLLGSFSSEFGTLHYSKDNGLTWEQEPAFMNKYGGWNVADVIRVKDQYYYTLVSDKMSWEIPEIALPGWHMVESTSRDREHEKELRRITGWLAWGNGRFVAAERNGRRILTSDDGQSWKEHKIAENHDEHSRYFFDIEWTGNEFILVGKQGTMLISKDGEKWSKVETGINGDLTGIASNGKLHIVVGPPPRDCSQSTSILISTDGEHWRNVGGRLDQSIRAPKANSPRQSKQ